MSTAQEIIMRLNDKRNYFINVKTFYYTLQPQPCEISCNMTTNTFKITNTFL